MSRHSVRVLVVAPSLERVGGQSIQAARLVSDLEQEASVQVSFLPTDTALRGPLEPLRSVRYARTVARFPLYVGSLAFRIPGCDVVHVFAASFSSFALVATPAIVLGRLFRRKVIVNYHSGEAGRHLTRWRSAVPTLRRADAIVVQSPYLQKMFARFGLASEVIANHAEIDALPFRARGPLRPLFLSTRALEPDYDVATVLRAFAVIQRRVPAAELRIVGDGSCRGELVLLSRELGLRGITFTGALDPVRMAEAYDTAEVLLNASTVDSMPLTLLEAFGCGLPVVSTDAGGIPEVVTNEETGLLVPVRRPDAMAAAALRLLDDPELAARLAAAARAECCEKYSWSATRRAWLALYERLVGEGPSRRKGIGRLRGRSRDELRVRGAQRLSVLRERARGRTSLEPDAADVFATGDAVATDLLAAFRGRAWPRLSPAFDDRHRTVDELRNRFDTAVERADRIAESRFDLLGHRDLSFGTPIDWHLDPVSGRRTGLGHWSTLTRPSPRASGDRKVVWELNRHQSFVVLGRAYWVTGDERYAQVYAEQLDAWIDQNPVGLGVNWSSSLEVALRSIAWTWALHLFRDSPALTPDLFRRALELLHLHARHVETYLSTYSSPNTHLTGEALGLFYVGTAWPELRHAALWREAGREILLSCLERQVKADGVYFERASAYHCYTTDFYTHFLVLDDEPEAATRDRIASLFEHLLFIARPDGTLPLLGDDDGGRLLPLDEREYGDLRPTLALGAALFGRPDYKSIVGAPSEEVLWLLGPEGLSAYERLESLPPRETSRAFRDGGFYVMRDGWSDSADVLTATCGDHARGHGHADALSFDLCVGGRPVLVDPGTFSYLRGAGLDDYFRSTAAHNTVVADGLSSSVPAGPFGWSRVAQCSLHAWLSNEHCDFLECSHNGYRRLADPVTHVRTILYLKGLCWIIRDRLVAAGEHRYDVRFHFAPDSQPVLEASVVREPGLSITTLGAAGTWTLSPEWVSPRYGARASAPVATFTTEAVGEQDLVTFLLPGRAGTVQSVAADSGRAYEIDAGDAREPMLVQQGGGDFEWTWSVSSGEVLAVRRRRSDGRWVVETEAPCAV